MVKHKQLFRHKPEEGIIGDCERTAIACLLEYHPLDVPHFGKEHFDDAGAFNAMEDRYLLTQGYTRVQIPYDCDLETLLKCARQNNALVYYLLSGQSKTGCNHTVICCGDRIVWDPSLDDSGIIGPCSGGYYWITYLVPMRFMEKLHA